MLKSFRFLLQFAWVNLGGVLGFAAVVTDEYGREAVYNDIPYILENGALTWPSGSASDTDPTHWEYDA